MTAKNLTVLGGQVSIRNGYTCLTLGWTAAFPPMSKAREPVTC